MTLRYWGFGRRVRLAWVAPPLAAVSSCPALATYIDLGPSEMDGVIVNIMPRDVLIILGGVLLMCATVPALAWVDAVGERRIVWCSCLAAASALMYAAISPWLLLCWYPSFDEIPFIVHSALLNVTVLSIVLVVNGLIGLRWSLPVCGVIIMMLLGTASWQLRLWGFSILQGGLHEDDALHTAMMVVLVIGAMTLSSLTRLGARPLLTS